MRLALAFRLTVVGLAILTAFNLAPDREGAATGTAYVLLNMADTNDAAPGGGTLGGVSAASISDNTELAFIGGGAVWLRSGQGLSKVAAAGDPAPGGGVLTSFATPGLAHLNHRPDINNSGQVVFFAVVDGGATGLYSYSGGTLSRLAVAGDPTAGGKTLGGLFYWPSLNNGGAVSFT